ncbi:hypothetical protein ON010_g6576 [Phytophthora cinnamomi]|nr:hypothetical protein ON010_g6576 [Phytophthora cinnamomi]
MTPLYPSVEHTPCTHVGRVLSGGVVRGAGRGRPNRGGAGQHRSAVPAAGGERGDVLGRAQAPGVRERGAGQDLGRGGHAPEPRAVPVRPDHRALPALPGAAVQEELPQAPGQQPQGAGRHPAVQRGHRRPVQAAEPRAHAGDGPVAPGVGRRAPQAGADAAEHRHQPAAAQRRAAEQGLEPGGETRWPRWP